MPPSGVAVAVLMISPVLPSLTVAETLKFSDPPTGIVKEPAGRLDLSISRFVSSLKTSVKLLKVMSSSPVLETVIVYFNVSPTE